MPATVPGGLSGLVYPNNARSTTWSTGIKITRKDGAIFAFTDHDQDVVISGLTYKSALSYQRTSVRTGSDGRVDTAEIQGVLDSTEITDADINAKKFNGAAYKIFWFDWTAPSSGIISFKTGTIGQITRGQNSYNAEMNGLTEMLQTQFGIFYSPTCRNDLGDSICGFDLTGKTVDGTNATQTGTVSAVTDNRTFAATGLTGAGPREISYTATTISFALDPGQTNGRSINDSANGFLTAPHIFAAQDAIRIIGSASNDTQHTILSVTAGQIITVNNVTYAPKGPSITIVAREAGYFDRGTLTWLTGNNEGSSMDVATWDGSGNLVLLDLTPNAIQIGDTFSIKAGCDKRCQTCVKKFNNLLGPGGVSGGFEGEPTVPGQDAILVYPNGG